MDVKKPSLPPNLFRFGQAYIDYCLALNEVKNYEEGDSKLSKTNPYEQYNKTVQQLMESVANINKMKEENDENSKEKYLKIFEVLKSYADEKGQCKITQRQIHKEIGSDKNNYKDRYLVYNGIKWLTEHGYINRLNTAAPRCKPSEFQILKRNSNDDEKYLENNIVIKHNIHFVREVLTEISKCKNEERLTYKKIAKQVGIGIGTVNRAVKFLKENGYIKKENKKYIVLKKEL